jgi:hypothetical protein
MKSDDSNEFEAISEDFKLIDTVLGFGKVDFGESFTHENMKLGK